MTDRDRETLEAMIADVALYGFTNEEVDAIRSLLAQVAECEQDHPPEPEYTAWVEAGKPDVREVLERLEAADQSAVKAIGDAYAKLNRAEDENERQAQRIRELEEKLNARV